MYKKFLPLLVLLSLLSCGQQGEPVKQTIGIKLRGIKALSAAQGAIGYGGAMIWGRRVDGIEGLMAIGIPEDATQVTLDIPSGIWEFAMMAWTGTEDETDNFPDSGRLTGTPFCDYTDPVDVSGENAAISLDVSAGSDVENLKCFDPIFGNPDLAANTFPQAGSNPNLAIASYPVSRFSKINLVNCSSFDELDLSAGSTPDFCDSPPVFRGRYTSYQVELLGIDPLSNTLTGGIRSDCLESSSGPPTNNFLSAINIPGRFPVRIIAYDGGSCGAEAEGDEPVRKKEFLFSGGLEELGDGFDHYYLKYGSGTGSLMGLHLPDSISGSGFSAFSEETPAYTCYIAGEYGKPCTVDQTFDRRFEAVVELSMASGTGPYNFKIPKDDIQTTPTDYGTCAINAGSFPSIVASGTCSCGSEVCNISLTGKTGCSPSDLCKSHELSGNSKVGSFHINFDGGTNYSMHNFVLIDGRMKSMLDTIWEVGGHPQGHSPTSYAESNSDDMDTRQEGVIGTAFELLGASTVGGVLFSQGVTTCDSASAGQYTVIVEEEGNDEVETAVITISENNTSIIPNFIFGPRAYHTNTSNLRFDKKMNINLSFEGGTEKIELEFNCASGSSGSIAGAHIGHGVFNETDTENGKTYITKQEFFYNSSPEAIQSTNARAELFTYSETVGENKYWEAIRLLRLEDTQSFAASFPALDNRSYGYKVSIGFDLISGLWHQIRSMFTTSADYARLADESYSGFSYTSNQSLAIPANYAPFDSGNICRNLTTFEDDTSCSTAFAALELVTTIAGENAISDPISRRPILDPVGDFHMDWVGKLISGGPCNGKSAMECAIKNL